MLANYVCCLAARMIIRGRILVCFFDLYSKFDLLGVMDRSYTVNTRFLFCDCLSLLRLWLLDGTIIFFNSTQAVSLEGSMYKKWYFFRMVFTSYGIKASTWPGVDGEKFQNFLYLYA